MARCKWYKCDVESAQCLATKAANRLFCRECSLFENRPAEQPPKAAEPNPNLGAWPDAEVSPSTAHEEVNVEKTEAQMPESIGAAIRQLREAKGLSQRALADKLGIAIASLNRWEKGKVIPNNSSLGILDDYFESDLERRFGAVLKTEELAADEGVAEEAAAPAQTPAKTFARQAFLPDAGERVQARPTLPQADGPASCAHCPALSHMAAALGRLTEFLQAAH